MDPENEVSPQLYFPSTDSSQPQLPLGQPETLSPTDYKEATSQGNSSGSANVNGLVTGKVTLLG